MRFFYKIIFVGEIKAIYLQTKKIRVIIYTTNK